MIIDHFRYLLQFSFWPLLYLDFFPWPPLIWNFWSCLTRMDLPFTNIDLQMSSWALWKAWSVCYLLKMFLSLKNELSVQEMRSWKKKSVSLLNHYCSSLVNTKMLLATSKYHPRDLKFESVGQLFMRNGNFSRKWELFYFWHISTMVWATLHYMKSQGNDTWFRLLYLEWEEFFYKNVKNYSGTANFLFFWYIIAWRHLKAMLAMLQGVLCPSQKTY